MAKEQRIIENVADVSELVYTLGLGNQVKVSVTDDTMIMISMLSMLCYASLSVKEFVLILLNIE